MGPDPTRRADRGSACVGPASEPTGPHRPTAAGPGGDICASVRRHRSDSGAKHRMCRHLAVHGHTDRILEMGTADTSAAICCPVIANSPRGTDKTEPRTSELDPWSPTSRARAEGGATVAGWATRRINANSLLARGGWKRTRKRRDKDGSYQPDAPARVGRSDTSPVRQRGSAGRRDRERAWTDGRTADGPSLTRRAGIRKDRRWTSLARPAGMATIVSRVSQFPPVALRRATLGLRLRHHELGDGRARFIPFEKICATASQPCRVYR